jgi:hypothetical protein
LSISDDDDDDDDYDYEYDDYYNNDDMIWKMMMLIKCFFIEAANCSWTLMFKVVYLSLLWWWWWWCSGCCEDSDDASCHIWIWVVYIVDSLHLASISSLVHNRRHYSI